jgi:hypothetical protein
VGALKCRFHKLPERHPVLTRFFDDAQRNDRLSQAAVDALRKTVALPAHEVVERMSSFNGVSLNNSSAGNRYVGDNLQAAGVTP